MTNDEQNTARELITNAFSDLIGSAEQIHRPTDIAKLIAKNLKNDSNWWNKLRNHDDAALLAVRMHEHGTNPQDPRANLGSLEVEVIARIPHKEATILNSLTNPTEHYAYAIAVAAEHPEHHDHALLLIMATRQHGTLLAIAIDDDEQTLEAWRDDHDREMPDDLRATITALNKAIAQ